MHCFNEGSSGNRSPFLLLLAAFLLLAGSGVARAAGTETLSLVDLDGQDLDPFAKTDARVIVFAFARTDCPISNRYAPEYRRIYDRFVELGVEFWLVYPDPEEPLDKIRTHLSEYDYPGGALRDPEHSLVELTGVEVTPEVAVFTREGRMVYRGRIDDRYVAFGKYRPEPTVHDLADALEATLAGEKVAHPTRQAIGCYIPDRVEPTRTDGE